MPHTPFTASEVRSIFELSESGGGHSGARHVNPSKDYLWQRVRDYKGSGLALRTSFLTFDDQISAALDVLNNPLNDAALESFRVSAKASDPRPVDMKDLTLRTPMRMHYGIGGGAQIYLCRHVTLVLRKCGGRPRDMHIVTFFGTMGALV